MKHFYKEQSHTCSQSSVCPHFRFDSLFVLQCVAYSSAIGFGTTLCRTIRYLNVWLDAPGFPPPPEKRITQPDTNFFSFPIARGQLDENALVGSLIPALKGSAFANATVRQVMDMTTALKYSEDYADPNADIWQYSSAANPLPKPAGYQGPVGYYEYLMAVPAAGEHGKVFGYKTVNSDVLGWVLANVTGKPCNQLVSELLWQPFRMQ